MQVDSFSRLIKTERTAYRYLAKWCWKNYRRFCLGCGRRKVYWRPGHRYHCTRCHYTFGEFTGRWLGRSRLSTVKWLWVIKLFELECSARRIAREVGMSYPTALRAVHTIRRSILSQDEGGRRLLRGEVEADEAYFGGRRKGKRGRGAAGKVPVFGILERRGVVHVEVVPNVQATTLLDLTVKKVRRGSIVYTDRSHGYDTLMFCGYRHLRVNHRYRFTRGKVYVNGLEGFWAYAKERLIKFHGVSKEYFPLYLKELEFRYNHRHHPVFERLVQNLCQLVPDHL